MFSYTKAMNSSLQTVARFSFISKFQFRTKQSFLLLRPLHTCPKIKLLRAVCAKESSLRLAGSSTTGAQATMEDRAQEAAPPTAGIIVIGDEILKGRTQDTNGHFIAQRLHKLGVQVKKLTVIGDEVSGISDEVRQFADQFTYVITSGGIGPTHDDLTFQGIADAFGDHLIAHPELVSFIGDYFKTDDLSSPPMKMAHVPSTSRLIYGEDRAKGYKSPYPVVQVRNVTVLPGVPRLLEKAFAMLDKRLFGEHRHVVCRDVYLAVDEVTIAAALNSTVTQHPAVTIGSYPELLHSYYKTHLTLEGADAQQVDAAKQHFLDQIDPAYELRDYVTDSVSDAWPRLRALQERSTALGAAITESLTVLEDCLKQYRPEEICVCFNGGKDCLLVLHLFYAMLHKRSVEGSQQSLELSPSSSGNSSSPLLPVAQRLQAVYITEENAFPQITQFVNKTINRYDLECTILPGPLKGALHELLKKKPGIKAVIMGTRRTDPYSDSLSFFQRTDNDWPVFMRVHPILNWGYKDVWDCIRALYLPYCTLYDRGYTSLGNAGNTVQNPLLQTTDRLGAPTYRPAYMLQDPQQERNGRT